MTLNTDPEAWARLGRAVRLAREAKGLTQEQLGGRAGVSGRIVQSVEAGSVPRRRMPYTLTPIARELGWPVGTVDEILAGGAAPGWRDVEVRPQVDAAAVESAISSAMVRATDNATAAEIRRAVDLALDELRRAGVVPETDGAQPTHP